MLIYFSYSCEIFTRNPAEAAIVLNFFRLAFGLSIAFYINPWVGLMGFNWAYGMMACLQVFSFFFVVLLMCKGHEIRQWQFGDLMHSEEGEHILEKQDKSN